MTDKDKGKFMVLMTGMNEASPGSEKISKEKLKIYFDFLKDLPFEEIQNNANSHFCKNKWFPAICELRGTDSSSNTDEAIQAYETIGRLLKNNYHPLMLKQVTAVKKELEKINKPEWVAMLEKWAWGIQNSTNSAVTRKQFIDSFNSAKNKRIDEKALRLEPGKQKKTIGAKHE